MSRAYAIIPDTLCHISNLAALKKALEARNCMRADRLLSIMLLLQTYRRMTARDLAERLEVSERTIHFKDDACECLLGFGDQIEVIEPQELWRKLVDRAESVVEFYSRRMTADAT
jgi:predicted DNA-binding transcriptional regulator YafY